MTAIYRARSEIAVNVNIGGRQRHVRFSPLSDGGSIYVTDDPAMQEALEAHPRHGRLFARTKTTDDGNQSKKKRTQ